MKGCVGVCPTLERVVGIGHLLLLSFLLRLQGVVEVAIHHRGAIPCRGGEGES